jgi:aryl-alcohol dehydrogenase-like predicted oxidoreductase
MTATPTGTERYAARHRELTDFYRTAQGLTVSSLGIGSYLGSMSDDVDQGYEEAIRLALQSGINFIDTSLNYRHQRSELAIGRALAKTTEIPRDEIVICTKAGYLAPGAAPPGLPADDIVGGMHCLAPVFLRDQLERSRANLGIETIDVFYLHNPETQLQYVSDDVFYGRIHEAFETAETMVSENRLSFYGVATWPGFRAAMGKTGLMSLPKMAEIAHEVAGDRHRFRFVQLPLNLAMTEGFTVSNQVLGAKQVSVLAAARELGITVIASATLLQARLSRELPEQLRTAMPTITTDAQRAIQFTRSTPGVSVALVGMSNPEHVRENIGIARVPPIAADVHTRMFADNGREA